ncbi:unannotated protein [freshwater metagenome]|uniref:Unannotated protein n=1 Tax=freshwater metagenome TaxID=449393 RepID=A0A6J6J646_9ZZZZ|nr:hypothetical protein [Actinomycetota bacterium]
MSKRIVQSNLEAGSSAPLGIGLALISLATILVFASASSVFLLQRHLTSLAEYAALSNARYHVPAAVFIRETGGLGIKELRVAAENVVDGLTVEVTICSVWQPALPRLVELPKIEVCGRGAARAG